MRLRLQRPVPRRLLLRRQPGRRQQVQAEARQHLQVSEGGRLRFFMILSQKHIPIGKSVPTPFLFSFPIPIPELEYPIPSRYRYSI